MPINLVGVGATGRSPLRGISKKWEYERGQRVSSHGPVALTIHLIWPKLREEIGIKLDKINQEM